MARRRRKDRPLNDLFEIVAKLPWWVGTALAVVSFLVFHALASGPPPAPADIRDIGSSAAKTIFRTVAGILQFVVPLVLVGASVASFFTRRR